VVVAKEDHALDRRDAIAVGGFEQADANVLRIELEPVEVARHLPVRLHEHDDGGVAVLVLARVAPVGEADGLGDAADLKLVDADVLELLRRVVALRPRPDGRAKHEQQDTEQYCELLHCWPPPPVFAPGRTGASGAVGTRRTAPASRTTLPPASGPSGIVPP